jgi:hypothetical protein
VAPELTIDQERQAKAQNHLEEDRPADEMRGDLKIAPDVLARQQALVVAQANPLDLPAGLIGAVVGEAEVDRPQQRKDVDREQEKDAR